MENRLCPIAHLYPWLDSLLNNCKKLIHCSNKWLLITFNFWSLTSVHPRGGDVRNFSEIMLLFLKMNTFASSSCTRYHFISDGRLNSAGLLTLYCFQLTERWTWSQQHIISQQRTIVLPNICQQTKGPSKNGKRDLRLKLSYQRWHTDWLKGNKRCRTREKCRSSNYIILQNAEVKGYLTFGFLFDSKTRL